MIVLASGSPQRRAILEQLGIEFRVQAPEVEEAVAGEPRALVIENALRKARAVTGLIVLGVDTAVVADGRVIYVYDNQEASEMVALAAATGDEMWRGKREERTTWATPLVWETEKRVEVVVPGKKRIRSYGLDGSVLWELDGRMSNLVIPSPLVADVHAR